MGWFFLIVFIVCIIIFVFDKEGKAKRNAPQTNMKNLKKTISENGLKGIEYISYNSKSAAIINEEQNKLSIYKVANRDNCDRFTFEHFSYNLDDIIESELIVDDQTITKTSKGGMVVGGLAGGVLLGGVGAIIGGLSGSKRSVKNISNIEIKLTVNDLHNPIHKINFLNNESELYLNRDRGYKQEHPLCKEAIEQAEKWQGMFDVILKSRNNY